MSFRLDSVPRVISSVGALQDAADLLQELGCSRVLVVTDDGVLKSGILDETVGRLRSGLQEVLVFSAVSPDPPEAIVLAAAEMAKDHRIDGVLGVGGGSSLDTAKLTALLARTPQPLSKIYGIGLTNGPRFPLILSPTTAGTGSETTPIAIVTTPSDEKKGVVSRLLLPDVAILDAATTLSLPAEVTAATGLDAAVHAIEAYTSKHLKNPVSDALAIAALQQIHAHLDIVLADGFNLESRSAMMEASFMAGMAFANAPVAAIHALAYPLGARFHLPHGLCNALMLPHVLRFNCETHSHLYARLCEGMFPEARGLTEEVAASMFLSRMEELLQRSGLLLRLADWGVQESDLRELAVDAMKIDRLLRNNPRLLTLNDAENLYALAFGGTGK